MSESRATGRWTRRDLLRGVAGVGVGTLVGTAAHGYLYEREGIELTRATLEVCLSILRSAQQGRTIILKHQVAAAAE